MVAILPSSTIATAYDSAFQLVAHTLEFQTRTGSLDATEALTHIYEFEILNVAGRRPCCMIDLDDTLRFAAVRGRSCKNSMYTLDMAVAFILTLDVDRDHDKPFLDFLNFAGNVCDQMWKNFGADGIDSFAWNGIEIGALPNRPHKDKRSAGDDFFVAVFLLTKEKRGGR